MSPLLYGWYVNDLVSLLSTVFGTENIFAYADDIAILCLGFSDLSRALNAIQDWCNKNGALLNRKKCGILPIRKREESSQLKEYEGIPFVRAYKYLGVPLDSALTLKDLRVLVQDKIKRFTQRIGLVLRQVVGTAAKLNLWQTYARCHFEYFSPAIAICKQFKKFNSSFTTSLKKALDLPARLPNGPLLNVLGIPSLVQIAGYHVNRNELLIRHRYGKYPSSLVEVAEALKPEAEQYRVLKEAKENKPVSNISPGHYRADVRSVSRHIINKDLLGLATGIYLTLRHTQGFIGTLKKCETCGTNAT